MKRKVFATAVVLVVMATPLFGAQAASPAKPVQGATAAQKTQDKPAPAAAPAAAKPTAPAAQKAAPADSKQSPATAAKAPAAPAKPSAAPAAPATKSAPGAPKAPTGLAVADAKPAPKASAPALPQPAAATKTPAATPKAAPAVATKNASPAPAVAKTAAAPAVNAAPATLSAVQQKVQGSKELTTQLQTKLAAGTDIVSAAGGFRDLQQFVAAVHASHNLGLKFDDVKAKLLNATKRTSLRQVIQDLRPAASAAIEAQRAEYDAAGTITAAEQAAKAAAADPATAKPVKTTSKPKASSTTEK